MRKLLAVFLLLQIADFATTAVVISMGGREQNPLVLHLMGLGTFSGLAVAKLIVMGLAVAIALAGRRRVLRNASYVFGVIVLWNLTIIGRILLA
jgi:hypothetical protein